MAYPYTKGKLALKKEEINTQAEQQSDQAEIVVIRENIKEIAEIQKDLGEIKGLIEHLIYQEARCVNKNFNYLVNDISPKLNKAIIEQVTPMIRAQKDELERIDFRIHQIKDNVRYFFWFSGIKEVLFWLSTTANIGLAAYFIYRLVQGLHII